MTMMKSNWFSNRHDAYDWSQSDLEEGDMIYMRYLMEIREGGLH